MNLINNSLLAYYVRRGRKRWTPAALFAQGQQGVWYEPKPEYLFQDAAGTTPVEADGDPVGYMQDLSGNGNHATQSTSADRPIYRTDGTLHWLEGGGTIGYLTAPGTSSKFQFLHNGLGGVMVHAIEFLSSGGYDTWATMTTPSGSGTGAQNTRDDRTGGDIAFVVARPASSFSVNGILSIDTRYVARYELLPISAGTGNLLFTVNGTNEIDVERSSLSQDSSTLDLRLLSGPSVASGDILYFGGVITESEVQVPEIDTYLANLAGITL